MPTDAQLLIAWREGDEAAGNQLVSTYFPAVYRFFRNKVDGDLDDFVQATFVKCTQARDRIEGDASFAAYLFATARNVLTEHYRSRSRSKVDFTTTSAVDLGVSASQLVEAKQEQRLLLAALRAIPLDEQIALELVYWEQCKGREVARVFGVPEGTARTLLRSAKLALRAKLAELARSPAVLASTLDDLDRWSASIRDVLAANADA